jgi:hypothetical protein
MKKTTWGNYLKRSLFIYHRMNVCLQICSDIKYADPKRLEGNENGRCRIGCELLYSNFPLLSGANSEPPSPPHTLYCPKYDKNHHNNDNYLAATFCKQFIHKLISMNITADTLLQECSCYQ